MKIILSFPEDGTQATVELPCPPQRGQIFSIGDNLYDVGDVMYAMEKRQQDPDYAHQCRVQVNLEPWADNERAAEFLSGMRASGSNAA